MFYLGDVRRYANIFSPNNILGIEYLKAMKKLKSNIRVQSKGLELIIIA